MPHDVARLSVEIEDLNRTMPPLQAIRIASPENLEWLGRLAAVVEAWNPAKGIALTTATMKMRSPQFAPEGVADLVTIVHQARHDLRMQTSGPLTVAIGSGMTFDYFDAVRKVIEAARSDVFFCDPYLDAEFISRYLPLTETGVTIRLLGGGGKKLATLLSAVQTYALQTAVKVSVRSNSGFHDRYVFIDRAECYNSGASFKDGAKTAATTLTQITDAFQSVYDTYERIWSSAKAEYETP